MPKGLQPMNVSLSAAQSELATTEIGALLPLKSSTRTSDRLRLHRPRVGLSRRSRGFPKLDTHSASAFQLGLVWSKWAGCRRQG